MHRRFGAVTGFVLAGGASRRMGRPKAELVLGGETMLVRQVRLLRSVCRIVGVIGQSSSVEGPNVPVYPDEISGRGPLGGIYTGLVQTRTEYNIFLGCDLPFMQARFLQFVCSRALESGADVTVPESREHEYETLCAVYRRRALWAVRATLEAGENKISRFFPRVRCLVVPWREIVRAGFSPGIFDNMNTPEHYEAAVRRVGT